jgi:alkylated DNA repair dioxygenase AlkB
LIGAFSQAEAMTPMDYFNTTIFDNLLPHGGIVNYHGKIMRAVEADYYLQQLLQYIEWKNDEAVIFGRHIITKRKAAWYGDEGYAYTYSNTTKQALPWTDELLQLKQKIEKISGENFNSCLLNLYHSGEEGMAYHSDDEKTLGKDSAIASLSFGAERKFLFKHKQTKETTSVVLESGSLLIMKGATQTNWLHRLPPTKKVSGPRVNLTFRTIVR